MPETPPRLGVKPAVQPWQTLTPARSHHSADNASAFVMIPFIFMIREDVV